VTGEVYKCHTQPVGQAVAGGLYGSWAPSAEQQARLEVIFPNGVCDYSQPGVGDPNAPAFVARFSTKMCGTLDHFVDVFGFADVGEMIRNGVRGFAGVAEAGYAQIIERAPANDGPCERVVTWPEEDLARVYETADAFGIGVDQLHRAGGMILPLLVLLAARTAPA
jgi:hypothetical protein